ncbi:MAG: DNA replication initiation complex subunit (GINS family) [Pirellulaceae bacterium]|jgi:DNA replication initiation complex subunit (GINS family)
MLNLSYFDMALLAMAAFTAMGMIARLMLEEHRRLLAEVRADIEEERARIERENQTSLRPEFDDYDAENGEGSSTPNSDAA